MYFNQLFVFKYQGSTQVSVYLHIWAFPHLMLKLGSFQSYSSLKSAHKLAAIFKAILHKGVELYFFINIHVIANYDFGVTVHLNFSVASLRQQEKETLLHVWKNKVLWTFWYSAPEKQKCWTQKSPSQNYFLCPEAGLAFIKDKMSELRKPTWLTKPIEPSLPYNSAYTQHYRP